MELFLRCHKINHNPARLLKRHQMMSNRSLILKRRMTCWERAATAQKPQSKTPNFKEIPIMNQNHTISKPKRVDSPKNMPIRTLVKKDWCNWTKNKDICFYSPIMTNLTSSTSTRLTWPRPGSSCSTSDPRAKTHYSSKSSIQLFRGTASTRREDMNSSICSRRPYLTWAIRLDTMCNFRRNATPPAGPSTSNSRMASINISSSLSPSMWVLLRWCLSHLRNIQAYQDQKKWLFTSSSRKRCATTWSRGRRNHWLYNGWWWSISAIAAEYRWSSLEKTCLIPKSLMVISGPSETIWNKLSLNEFTFN